MLALDPATAILVYLTFGIGIVALGMLGVLSKRFRIEGRGLVGLLIIGVIASSMGTGVKSSAESVPLMLFGLACGILALSRTSLLATAYRLVITLLRRRVMASACLACLGVGMLGWQVYALDRQMDRELRETDEHFELVGGRSLESIRELQGRTDGGTSIAIKCRASAPEGTFDGETTYIRSFKIERQVIQTGPPDDTHNCHGWVFTGGMGWVGGESVLRILAENRYQRVTKPAVGDLVVFHDLSGHVSHTAVVRVVRDEGSILVESKWGRMGRYIHTLETHAYSSSKHSFYHSPRTGHRLRGLGYQANTIVLR